MNGMSSAQSSARAFRRPRDMFLSLAVLLVPIAAFFLVWNLVADGSQARRIDPTSTFTEAEGVGLAVMRPDGLDVDWQPVSAAMNHESGRPVLRVGYQTPDGAGVQLVETSVDPEALLAAELSGGSRPDGSTSQGGRDWQVFQTPGGNAVVYSDESITVLVHGDTDVAELSQFVRALV